jgi:hypothetical protein
MCGLQAGAADGDGLRCSWGCVRSHTKQEGACQLCTFQEGAKAGGWAQAQGVGKGCGGPAIDGRHRGGPRVGHVPDASAPAEALHNELGECTKFSLR